MKVAVVSVGKAKGAVGEAIAEYEARARRYFAFEAHEVKEEPYRGRGAAPRRACGTRRASGCWRAFPAGAELVALHETGRSCNVPCGVDVSRGTRLDSMAALA